MERHPIVDYADDGTIGAAPDVFFDKNGLLVPLLAESATAGTCILVGGDHRLWRFDHGVYRPDGELFIRIGVKERLGSRFRARHSEEVIAYLRAQVPQIGEHPPAGLLNVRNGLVNLQTMELQPHDPKVPSFVQLPVMWHADAACPAIDRFLADVLPRDAVDIVWEVLGYATYPGNPFRKAVLLLGPTGTGKSKLLGLLEAMLGKENVSNTPLQDLAENRFAVAELFGVLANICGDLDARAVKRSDQFKMMTGGDTMVAERKYGHPFRFVCTALPVFSANEPPISSDQTDAWFERWVIVPMEQRIEGSKRDDPYVLGKIITDSELSGALVKAVDGLRRLMIRGRFDLPDSVRQAGSRYRSKLDTVAGFVDECCIFDPQVWVARSILYPAYRRWCESSGRFPVSTERFYDHLRANHGEAVEDRKREGSRGFAGIGLAAR